MKIEVQYFPLENCSGNLCKIVVDHRLWLCGADSYEYVYYTKTVTNKR